MRKLIRRHPMNFKQAMAILEKQYQNTLAKIELDKKLHQEEMQKRDEEMQKRDAEFKLQMQKYDEASKKRDAEFKNLSRRFGDLGNRLGEIVEYLVTSNLKEKFDKYGFYFRSTMLKVEINNEKRQPITDIDVLLYDGDRTMAVEVKTRPTQEDVKRHILRMQQIQKYTPGIIENKRVYGAIAGAIIDKDVLDAAFEAGFYVISQTDDNVDIIPPPADFVAKYWDAETSSSSPISIMSC